MTRRPTDTQFEIAIAWLGVNEGDNGEAEACQAVAAYVRHQEREAMIRREARKGGIPVKALRKRLAELAKRIP